MGRITLVAQLQSNIQSGLKSIQGAVTQTGSAINTMGRRANAAMGQVNGLNNALGVAQQRAAQAAQNIQQASKATHEHGITTGRLIVMMVKFGIILNALRLVTAPLGWMTEGVKTMVVLDKGMRNIVGMLANAGDTSEMLDIRYQRLIVDATRIQTQYGQTTEATVQGLYKVASVVDALNFTGVRPEVDKVNFALDYLGNIAAKDAVAGMTDIGTAADSLTAVLTGLNIPLIQTQEVSDILFQTVRLGKSEFTDVARDMGVLAGAFSSITKQGNEMQMLKETGGLYSFFSTFLPPEEARVSLQRMGLFLTGESKQAQDLASQIQQISGGRVNLTATAVREQGLMATFRSIADFVSPQNPLLKNYLQQRVGRPITEEEMGGVRFRLLTTIFDDARAARAALRVLGTDGTASLDKIMASMDQFGGATDRAFGEGQKSIDFRFNQLKESILGVSRSITGSALPGFGDMFGGIADRLDMLLQRPAFKDSSALGKLGFIFGDLYQAFSNWYYTEGGKEQIASMAETIGKDMGHFIMGVLGLNIKDESGTGGFKSAWYDAGKTAGGEFLRGLMEAINPFNGPAQGVQIPGTNATIPGTQGLQNATSRQWNNPILRAISGVALMRGLGGGWKTQLLGAVVGGGMGDDNPLGWVLEGLGLLSMFRGGKAGVTGFLSGAKAAPLTAGLSSLAKTSTMRNLILSGALMVGSKAPWLGKLLGFAAPLAKRVPLAGAAITAGMDMLGGQDLLYSIGHGLFTAGGSVLGGLVGSAAGPLGTVAGGIGGGFAGDWLFRTIFGEGKTNQAAAASETNQSIIDDYFQQQREQQAIQNSGGLTIIIPIEKLADNITAATPEEAEQLADRVFGRIVDKLEGITGNTASNQFGGYSGNLLTP